MDKAYTVSPKLRIASIILVLIGIAAIIVGFLSNPQRTWANYLINNYYFISLAIGSTFFMAIQYITQSGWSSMFKRIAEAMGSYIPYAAVLLFIFVLLSNLFHEDLLLICLSLSNILSICFIDNETLSSYILL